MFKNEIWAGKESQQDLSIGNEFLGRSFFGIKKEKQVFFLSENKERH